ncbi:MAG: response regulator transcription factor [Chloroflexota bacterium]|nr:response regulator transcription factor [Chloroflexota bacterium]
MTDSPAARIRVLVVDDHELVRAGLRAMLSAHSDIEIVAEAGTGAQALAMALAHRPDVVLLDARLPDIAGAEVCRRLRQHHPAAVVAILTTYSDDELVRDCVRAGAQGYLLKDIARLDLGRSIRALARGEGVVDSKVAPLLLAAARQAATADSTPPLTARQREILGLVAAGLSNREIAERTHVSELTVKGYIEAILQQLGARNRVHAAILATKNGWI